MNPFQFKIPKRQKKCVLCETPFENESHIFSVILGDEEEPERRDYCKTCFKQNAELTKDCWGHWETILRKPKKKLSLDQRAMELFTTKYEAKDQEWIYFLAHYLRRKKQLVFRSEIKKDGLHFFEDPITTEVYTISDVPLSDQRLLELKEEFIRALNDPEEEEIDS